jgi:tryptophanyl-tRNA synthetase
MSGQTVLSGIRATGRLHFGNFMGAVTHFVRYQQPGNRCMYFIADYHTLTTYKSPDELRGNVLEIATDYLAAGLNPDEAIIYAQSSVPEIPELSLLLSMVQGLGELTRMTTYKDLLRKNPDDESNTLGLITYPVLMAADILGPKATIVPVGNDQRPNVELARNLAQRFNNRFGDTFVIPNMMDEMVRVPGLRGDKMGKSDADDAIDINSPIAEIRDRYLRLGVTDPARIRVTDPGDPNKCQSVFPLHTIISPKQEVEEIDALCRSAGIGCVDCKHRLVNHIAAILEPFQEKRRELAGKSDFVRDVLHEGGKRARTIIGDTVAEVREKMGLVRY